MKINMTGMAYSFDAEGNTEKINVTLSAYEGGESMNASVEITNEDVKAKTALDDMTRKQVEAVAKEKCAAWFKA